MSKRDELAAEFTKPYSKEGLPWRKMQDIYIAGWDQAIEEVLKIMTEAWEPFDQVELKVFNKIKSLKEPTT